MYTRQSNSSYKHGTIPILGIPTIQERREVRLEGAARRGRARLDRGAGAKSEFWGLGQ